MSESGEADTASRRAAQPGMASSPGTGRTTQAGRHLQTALGQGARTAAGLGLDYRRLWGEMSAAVMGGKQVRPALFEAAYRAWGGPDRASAAAIGAAVEMLHTAFVIHDDVIDGDDVRRGRLNVTGAHVRLASAAGAGASQARGYGRAAGILAGDLALAGAMKAVAQSPCPRAIVHQLLDLFHDTIQETAAGELADVYLGLGIATPSMPEALAMERRKTAAYSFALPLQAAAILAEVDEREIDISAAIGLRLGACYQLVDDLIGVFGRPEESGKSALGDLRAGKQTPLVVHARGTTYWPLIAPYVGKPDLDEVEAERVRGLLREAGSHAFVLETARRLAETAVEMAQDPVVPQELRDLVTSTAAGQLRRRS